MSVVFVILIILLVFGGEWGYARYGVGVGGGAGILVLILLLWLIFGGV